MKTVHSLFFATLIQLCQSITAEWTVGQTVLTSSGPISGHAASKFAQVSEYLGVPYAAPPVGKLRFLAPQDVVRSNTTIVASKYGPDCPATGAGRSRNNTVNNSLGGTLGATFSQAGHFYSEDCLSLNIWTRPQAGEKKKAVLLWIYGGGFTTGSSNSPSYNGQVFSEKQDVIVVTINYRLNVFGFPAAPGLADLNLGLLDQRKATEWVRDNIAAFGGDPKRITIFGESAGSRAVDIYSFAWWRQDPAFDPIVNGFIMESGAAPMTTGTPWRPSLWLELSTRLGCGSAAQLNSTVECVRSKSVEDIIDATGTANKTRREIYRGFAPVVDGKTYFSDYEKRAAAGQFIQKPILVGNNNNEAGLFATINKLQGVPANKTEELFTNLGYTCGGRTAARRRAAKDIPVWRYRWMGEFPNQRISPTAGAWHGSEIPHVFGLPEGISEKTPATENQTLISESMNRMWAAFAKNPETGLSGWPQYGKNNSTTILVLAENNGSGVTPQDGEKYEADCNRLTNNVPGISGYSQGG